MHDVLTCGFGYDVLVDLAKNPIAIDVERPSVRIEAAKAEYAVALRGRPFRITQDPGLCLHRLRELGILLRGIETHVENVDIELGEL